MGNLFKVTVDYSKSLAEMIAAGSYDRKNNDIADKHFPIPKLPAGLPTKIELNLKLTYFNKCVTSEKAIAKLKKRGLRPATLPEMLAFGAAYKEKQREFFIVAFGSVWRNLDGHRSIPCLWGSSSERGLGLGWFESDWRPRYRFLAVRESSGLTQDES